MLKPPDRDPWVVASTHPHKETLALANLGRQGFDSYCPHIRKRVRHARQVTEVLRPLFPGYVFIRLDPLMQPWRAIDSTVGVRSLIRFGDRPGTVPDEFVRGLSSSEERGAVALPPARASYSPGETVRLREGPFDGVIATVLAGDDDERITVLMDLLKRSVRVQVAINEIVPVKPALASVMRPQMA